MTRPNHQRRNLRGEEPPLTVRERCALVAQLRARPSLSLSLEERAFLAASLSPLTLRPPGVP